MNDAVLPFDPPLRTCNEDGTYHYSQLKILANSGQKYLHACNTQFEPTLAMRLGTAVHQIILGARPGREVVVFDGESRRGNAYKEFAAAHAGRDILTRAEMERAERIAMAVRNDPEAERCLAGAQTEVRLEWEEMGLRFSSGGADIVGSGQIGDLKTTSKTTIDEFKRQGANELYHCQLAFYRRGANAMGIDSSRGLYVLAVQTGPCPEVVKYELTETMIAIGERAVASWLEKLRAYLDMCPSPTKYSDWPGMAIGPVSWAAPAYLDPFGDEEEEEEAA